MQIISDRGKHRLRIAARFLRQSGQRFDGDNFYSTVINSIAKLRKNEQQRLRELVDWLETYELMELQIYGEPPQRSRSRKIKPMFRRKQNRVSDAMVAIAHIHENIKGHEENDE